MKAFRVLAVRGVASLPIRRQWRNSLCNKAHIAALFSFFHFVSGPKAQEVKYYLPIRHTDASDYKVRVYTITDPKSRDLLYKARLEGAVRSDQILRWRIRVIESPNAPAGRDKPVYLTLHKGTRDKEFVIDKAYQFNDTLSFDDVIKPEIVMLPQLAEFQPVMESELPYLLKGDPFSLSVNPSRDFPNIEWVWKIDGDPSASLTGERLPQVASRSKTYRVYARHRNSEAFRTASKEVTVPVKDSREIVDFSIRGPGRVVDDTGSLHLSLDIRKDITRGEAEFRWYADGRNANDVPIGIGTGIQVSPPLTNSDYRVCAYHEGRRLACAEYHQQVQVLPAPGDFDFVPPGRLFANQPAVIRLRAKNPQAQYWTWSINGKMIAPKGRDSLLIPSPKPGMQVCVYPTLNGKGGASMRECIELRDVRVKTVLPSGVDGRMSRCSGDRSPVVYRLLGGTLGSDAKAWVLYVGQRRVRALRPGSDTLLLAPSRTTTYRIATETAPNTYYTFTIDVMDPPRLPVALKGPAEVCAGQAFPLEATGGIPDGDLRWRWYRRLPGESGPRAIGEGAIVQDSILFTAVYSLTAEKGGCSVRMGRDLSVKVTPKPARPSVSTKYLGKAQKRADVRLDGVLPQDMAYEWTIDGFASIAHTGPAWEGVSIPKEGLSVSVRAINGCGMPSDPAVQYLQRSASVSPRVPLRFLNVGITAGDPSKLGNIRIVVGSSRFWGSVVFNTMRVFGYPGYKSTLSGRTLEVDDAGRVANFPPGIGSYYEVNGNAISVRSGILLGTMFGRGRLRAYAGAGLGSRTLQWGLDVKPYNGAKVEKVWAENKSGTWNGIAAEAGVFIDLLRANLMFGMQSVIDPSRPAPYVEATSGIGIPLKKTSR